MRLKIYEHSTMIGTLECQDVDLREGELEEAFTATNAGDTLSKFICNYIYEQDNSVWQVMGSVFSEHRKYEGTELSDEFALRIRVMTTEGREYEVAFTILVYKSFSLLKLRISGVGQGRTEEISSMRIGGISIKHIGDIETLCEDEVAEGISSLTSLYVASNKERDFEAYKAIFDNLEITSKNINVAVVIMIKCDSLGTVLSISIKTDKEGDLEEVYSKLKEWLEGSESKKLFERLIVEKHNAKCEKIKLERNGGFYGVQRGLF